MAFLVMGSLNYDDNYFLDHIVMPGETIASQTMESACGGKGFNQAVALAKAGAEVYLAGLVGEADGAHICQEARENGIKDTFLGKRGLYRKGHHPDRPGRPEQYRTFGGANRKWTLEYVDKVLEHFQAEDILILQNEINVTAEIITKAWEKGMKIVLNPSPFEEKILNWPLEKVSLFLLNEVEGGQMTGEKEPEKILKRLQAKYPNADFVLTYGEKGAWYVGNGETVYCPAKKVKVIDTTAAGDTFTGYFLSARGRGYGVEESLKKATAAAGEAVTRKGAAVSIPCWKELEEK
ncbi:MAG: ribokinase [Lachnospiraceae bacterium]